MKSPDLKCLWLVYAALMILLIATVAAAYMPSGPLKPVVALGIAGGKTALIMMYFMQLRYRSGLVNLFAVAGFLWLAVMFLFTFADYLSRSWQGIAP